MKKLGVYILRCSNGRYYIGSTVDLDRRLEEHRQGRVKATRYVLPVTLVFLHACDTLQEARRLEYRIKTKKSRVILERIIKEGRITFAH